MIKQFLGVSLLFAFTLPVAQATRIKIGVMAPKGTTWANTISKVAKEVKKKTDGKVKFKVYYGGVQGDEPDVLRKIRVGQLHGGIFSGRTLGEIYPDVRVVEIPFTFMDDYEKATKTLASMTEFFNKGFKKKKMVNIGFFNIGMIYLVSKKKATNLGSLKGVKIWSWEGDKVVESLMHSLGLVSVPLALPDVLSSLSTGVIDAAYNSPLGTIALQWQSKIKYVVDYPVAFATSALLISEKSWKKVKPKYQKIILEVAKKHSIEANIQTRKENIEALASIKKLGVEFIKFPDSDTSKAASVREDVIKRLSKKGLLSKEALDRFSKAIK